MENLIIKNVEIGKGRPKICVVLKGKDINDLKEKAKDLKNINYDMLEIRLDYFLCIEQINKVLEALEFLRKVFSDKPIILTIRTLQEGGEKNISKSLYIKIYEEVISKNIVDIIDIELSIGEDFINRLINLSKENKVYTIISKHDFCKTPPKEEILSIIKNTKKFEPDFIKLSFMPKNFLDVLVFMETISTVYNTFKKPYLIGVSMSYEGLASRILGEFFGSVITFAHNDVFSKEGQLSVEEINKIFDSIYNKK